MGGQTEDQLRVREITSGVEMVVATAPVRNTGVFGGPGIDRAVVSGDWAVWIDEAKAPTTSARALSLVSGERRALDVGGSGCVGPTAGSRYFAWTCSRQPTSNLQPLTILDAKTLAPVMPIPLDTGVGTIAVDDGLLWFKRYWGAGGRSRSSGPEIASCRAR